MLSKFSARFGLDGSLVAGGWRLKMPRTNPSRVSALGRIGTITNYDDINLHLRLVYEAQGTERSAGVRGAASALVSHDFRRQRQKVMAGNPLLPILWWQGELGS